MYAKGIAECREQHVPVLFHIQEMTQPQGHSTSGSQERYKSKERLAWEAENDCNLKMREWMTNTGVATNEECDEIEAAAKSAVNEAKKLAWEACEKPIRNEVAEAALFFNNLSAISADSSIKEGIDKIKTDLGAMMDPARKDIVAAAKKILRLTKNENSHERNELVAWLNEYNKSNYKRYNSHLYIESDRSALKVAPVAIKYAEDAPLIDGREILQANFDALFANDPRLVAFGEDLGKIGDVNQGFATLQAKYGEIRITDVGIRESTIAGQGIGLALRGLRPIAEIQYIDYLLYALQTLSDDLSTLHYRTKGEQKAPVIIRTRGHRLEGIWHSGSPMGMIINSLRGIYILVPRNMTQAAGFYNTMLASDDPALIIECLNGYRLKEKLPANVGEFKTPLGIPEVLQEGNDVTIVTYGSCCRVATEAAQQLNQAGISCELIDVQTLLPFDIHHSIVESVKKTNKLLVLDEDVPGGASAYILQKILEEQHAFQYLDSTPRTVTAQAHRAAYGSDGDYFSKPNAENVFDAVYEMMSEYDPEKFPSLY
jgi:pyruvate/2-oxoglutarate/acetoin dehydrogenase E1 component